ncbi:MAG: long-chain fatty acid--CoA ligase [Bacteroidota bacterium]
MPELFYGLLRRFEGKQRTVLRYKDRKTKEWIPITWDELRDQVHAMAGYLHQQGVRPGDRVAVLSENRPEWTVTDLATQILGAVNVSLYTTLPASQVAYILKDSGAKLFITSTSLQLRKAKEVFDECPDLEGVVAMSELRSDHPAYVTPWDDALAAGATYWAEHEATLRPLAEAVTPADLSALIYTSGTTGNPKGVMLTHDNFSSNVVSSLGRIRFEEDDHHLSFLPLCHSFERTAGYIAVLACGATISYAESIDAVSKNLPEVRPTVMISVPRLFERIYNLIANSVKDGSPIQQRIFGWAVNTGKKVADKQRDGRSAGPILGLQQSLAHKLVFAKLHEKLGGNLRFAVSGGAALPKDIGEFFEAAGIKIIEGYGLTETSPVLAFNPFDRPRYGTVGHVIGGVTVGIQRLEDGTIIQEVRGEDYPTTVSTREGEIIVKGPNVMKGYWNNETVTRESIDDDGWYHTGDVGQFDSGYLRITDRIKHMIVSKGGKNIYPGPIEDGFKTTTWIDQISVVGEGREYLTALVVPDLDALKKYAREQDITTATEADLLAHEAIQKLFSTEFRQYSRKAASHEKIRDFRLIAEPFTVDNGMMTPTLKLKRRAIEDAYGHLIEDMYAGVV